MHISFIMDGNGRWAKSRGLPRAAGHKEGAKVLQKILPALPELGVDEATFYAFSTENWKRPEAEVSQLMQLFRSYLKTQIKKIHKNGAVFRVIGLREGLSPELLKLIDDAETLTAQNRGIRINLAVNYGGKDEILRAVRRISASAVAGTIASDDIDENLLESHLLLQNVPDLMIRTGGESRLSNFLLWQHAYTELMFLDLFWPDFNPDTLRDCIAQFKKRDRRFGGIDESK